MISSGHVASHRPGTIFFYADARCYIDIQELPDAICKSKGDTDEVTEVVQNIVIFFVSVLTTVLDNSWKCEDVVVDFVFLMHLQT